MKICVNMHWTIIVNFNLLFNETKSASTYAEQH